MFTEYLREHDLHSLLCAPEAYHPFPRRQEREKWEKLPADKRAEILAWGNEAHDGYPTVTATQFLAFVRTGDRQVYEVPYFKRRDLLIGAALAECIADDGTYLDDVIDGIWCICEETTWVLSAHNGSDHPGMPPMNERPLPDVTNPYVDLFAAQTAAMLADVLYLLADKLDAISPLIVRRVCLEIDRRVLTPFMQHDDFWWMGMIRQNVNNWTPWIVSNVIDAFLLLERDAYRRSAGIARGMKMLDRYLAVLPEDGGCDEGAGYFNVAGASLLDAMESVMLATDGRVNLFGEQKIRNIAAFPLFAHIDGTYFLNFADCDAQPQMDGERIAAFGRYTDNPLLAALGVQILHTHTGVKMLDTPQMNRVLKTLFAEYPPMEAEQTERFCALPELEVFTWRRGGLFVAAKGGHNDESHNHNDIGSFMIYADGEPQVIDMGNCVYTAKTFGPERYTLTNTRGGSHNVPLIGDFEQAAGRAYAARDVKASEQRFSADIAGAYPKEAGVQALVRTLRVEDMGVTLCDCVGLSCEHAVTWVFMLREQPEVLQGLVRFGKMALVHDSALSVHVQQIAVTDARMAKNFPGFLWRLTLTDSPAQEHVRTFTFQRS